MPADLVHGEAASDHDLMRGIAEGDTTSLGALYDRHGPTVMALCLRVLGARADAEEVLGDVFWQVWEQARRYDPARGSPVAYLLTMARSRALDRLRATGRRRKTLVEPDVRQPGQHPEAEGGGARAGQQPEEPAGSPFRAALLSEQRSRIEAALAGLEPAQRRVVEMSFYEDLTHSEIARTLGEPLGTIKSRIRQGLIRLREGLRAQYGPEAPA